MSTYYYTQMMANADEKKMVYYFNRSSMIKYSIMAHYIKTYWENKDTVEEEVKEFKEAEET